MEGIRVMAWLEFIFFLIVAYMCRLVAYDLLFHPLRAFPGPFSHKISSLPRIYHLINGRLTFRVAELHAKYGQVVRIGPNELAFANPQAWKDIYGHRKPGQPEFSKSREFYRPVKEVPASIISEIGREEHGQIRRQLAHAFSDNFLKGQESIIHSHVDLLIQRLHTHSSRKAKPLDLSIWLNWTTFDIVGDLGFGSSFGCLEKCEPHPWVKMVTGTVKSNTYMQVLVALGASWVVQCISRSGGLKARDQTRAMVTAKLQSRIHLGAERPDLVQGLIRLRDNLGMSLPQLTVNASALTIAGSETTATLLCGAIFLLGKNPEALARLADEVRTAFQHDSEITLDAVSKLEYMLACINEALRLYPPVAGGLPRVVPGQGEMVAGRFIPGGTTVAVWQWAINHEPTLWTRPDEFLPDRFMRDANFSADSHEALQPFSTGPRNCIGRNLAYAEIRLILAKLVFNFNMKLAEDSKDWLGKQASYTLWDKPALNVYLTPAG